MRERLKLDVEPVPSAQDAVHEVDILSTCTDSMTPTFEADWLEPGMHVVMLGPAEISDAAMDRFDVKIRQEISGLPLSEGERIQAEIGHSPIAYVAGTDEEMRRLPPKNTTKGFKADFPDYCDLILGRTPGRQSDKEITFYHNIGYQGLQYSAVGGAVYRKAKQLGVGREIPTEWFLQDIRD